MLLAARCLPFASSKTSLGCFSGSSPSETDEATSSEAPGGFDISSRSNAVVSFEIFVEVESDAGGDAGACCGEFGATVDQEVGQLMMRLQPVLLASSWP